MVKLNKNRSENFLAFVSTRARSAPGLSSRLKPGLLSSRTSFLDLLKNVETSSASFLLIFLTSSTQCLFNVGSPSATVAKHQSNNECMSKVSWSEWYIGMSETCTSRVVSALGEYSHYTVVTL